MFSIERRVLDKLRDRIIINYKCGRIAQWRERLPYKQEVRGSNPLSPTLLFPYFCILCFKKEDEVNGYRTRSDLRPECDDPYVREYTDPTICTSCGLVYHQKRWSRNPELAKKLEKKAEKSKCPACRKIEDGFFMGKVVLKGEFLSSHREEIENLVKNVEKREVERYPLDRIMEFKKDENEFEIKTTSEHLALAIGKAVHRSFGGEIEYFFRDQEKHVEVLWKRDKNKKGGKE